MRGFGFWVSGAGWREQCGTLFPHSFFFRGALSFAARNTAVMDGGEEEESCISEERGDVTSNGESRHQG